jgi:hypothetical protein
MKSPFEIDTSLAHAARVHNYLAGGDENFAADREAIEYAAAVLPGGLHAVRSVVRSMRSFMWRATTYLVQEAGVRQFLELGTAIPSAESLHLMAQQADPQVRVVYVSNDPVVLAHSHALRRSHPDGAAAYIHASLTDVEHIVHQAAATLDFAHPIAVVVPATMSFVPDERDPHGIIAHLVEYLGPGSFLALAHGTDEIDEVKASATRLGERLGTGLTVRSRAQIARFFDGLELIGPGLVPLEQWPEGSPLERPGVLVPLYVGVARKPLRPSPLRDGEWAARGHQPGTQVQTDSGRPAAIAGPADPAGTADCGDPTGSGDHSDTVRGNDDARDPAGLSHQVGAAGRHDVPQEGKSWSDRLSEWASAATIVGTVLSILALLGLWGRGSLNDREPATPTSSVPSTPGSGLPTTAPAPPVTAGPSGAPSVPTEILVTPDLGPSHETVEVMISGRGFAPNERIRVEVSPVEGVCSSAACSSLKDVHSDAGGSFDAVRVLVPLNFPGGRTVFLTARGMTSQRAGSQPFVVTVNP